MKVTGKVGDEFINFLGKNLFGLLNKCENENKVGMKSSIHILYHKLFNQMI